MKKLLELNTKNFLSGLSSGKYINNGLFYLMQSVDILRSKAYYGLLKPSYTATDVTSTIIKDEIKWFVKKVINNTVRIFGYGADGYLYQIAGYTSAPEVLNSGGESGRVGGRGLTVYRGLLHYFANTTIGTYNFDATYTNSAYSGLTSAPHPAKVISDILVFGNGNYVGTITDTTLNLSALTYSTDYEVRDIEEYNNYAVILLSNGFHSLILFWDLYSEYYTYKYEIYEDCTALEKYKDTFAVFGNNVHLFNGGGFESLYFLSKKIEAGATGYKQNIMFWVDDKYIRSYGTPIAGIQPTILSPFYTGLLSSNAIVPTNPDNTLDYNMIFWSSTDKKLYKNISNNYEGAIATTNKLDIGYSIPQKIVLYVDNFSNVNDKLTVYLEGANGYESIEFAYNTIGAQTVLERQFDFKPTDNISLTITFDKGDIRIKKIELYGETTNPIQS